MEKILITGSRGAGKTTFCSQLAEISRNNGFRVSGILSPGVFDGGKKIEIKIFDFQSQTTKKLAVRLPESQQSQHGLHWEFDSSSLEWGNNILRRSVPTDLLIIDELGPLELIQNSGWIEGITSISSDRYKVCVFVIRPELIFKAQRLWPGYQLIHLSENKNIAGLIEEIQNFIRSPDLIRIQLTNSDDQRWINELIKNSWGAQYIFANNEKIFPNEFLGFKAILNDSPAGLVTFREKGDELQVLTLNSLSPGRGIGRKLMSSVIQFAKKTNKSTITLSTTNDNGSAIMFYQKMGFRLIQIRSNAIEYYRQSKPEIPILGEKDVLLLDEIIMEFRLNQN